MTKDVFGNKVITDERGENLIIKTFEYPQSNVNSMKLFRFIELMNVLDAEINFPLRIIQKSISIFPSSDSVIRKYYSFKGIHTLIAEQELNGYQYFVKPEVIYLNESKYPVLTIHFFFVSTNDIGERMKTGLDLIQRCTILYENTEQFTEKRLNELEQLVEVNEIKLIPCIPLTFVQYDNEGNLENLKYDTYWA